MKSLACAILLFLPTQFSVQSVVSLIREEQFATAIEQLESMPGNLSDQQTDDLIQAFRPLTPGGEWVPLLEVIAEKSERDPRVLFFLSQACWRAGDVDGAMHYSGEAFERTDDPALMYQCAAIARTSQKIDIALERVEAVLDKAPRFDDAQFLKASIRMEQGETRQAKDLLLQLLGRNANHARAWYQLGLLETREGNMEAAESALREAIVCYPFFREAYGALRTPLGRLKKQEELQSVSRVLETMRSWSAGHIARLRTLHEQGTDVSLSEAEFLAFEMMKLGQEQAAIRYLTTIQEARPLRDSLRLMLAHLHFNQREYPDALKRLNEINSPRILGMEAYWGPYAWSLYFMERYRESRAIYNEYSEQFSGSGQFAELGTALEQVSDNPPSTPAEDEAGGIRFADVTRASGLAEFEHRLGSPEKNRIVDAMGSGVAVADYDNDGDDDIYFVNGQPDVDSMDPAWTNALFRNDNGRFVDVTGPSGVGDAGVGMVAVFGDVNGDGWLDLFVGNYGPNRLYLNKGDGTFRDATAESGLGDPGYAAAAAFADTDADGDLDLYVGNYIEFDDDVHGSQRMNYHGQRVFYGPLGIDPQRDRFYRNDGKGVFSEDTDYLDTRDPTGRAMGAVFFDRENDGDLDLFVANDSTYNFFFENQGAGGFEDISFFSGAAVNLSGRDVANMGAAVGDINRDGYLDFISTAYEQEPDNLYLNQNGEFTDVSASYGLAQLSYWLTTWGVGFCDFDADGQLDYYTVNGHVYPQVEAMEVPRTYPQGVSIYRQVNSRFEDVSASALPPSHSQISGRGSAFLDHDADGDLDIVINCIDDTPVLLENRSVRENWLLVRLVGGHSVYGARVVVTSGDETWVGIVDGGSSYLSQNASVVHFGLGPQETVDAVEILWNAAVIYRQENPPVNSVIKIPADALATPAGTR